VSRNGLNASFRGQKPTLAARAGARCCILVGLLLAGCTHRYQNALHPEYGPTDYDRDWYECRREAFHPRPSAAAVGGPMVAYQEYPMAVACMRARGWEPAD
jgi:hypothetical protein